MRLYPPGITPPVVVLTPPGATKQNVNRQSNFAKKSYDLLLRELFPQGRNTSTAKSRIKMRILPSHVRAARGLLKITQQNLADMAGVSHNTVSALENEAAEPSEDTLLRIVTALEQRGIQFLNSGQPGVRLVR